MRGTVISSPQEVAISCPKCGTVNGLSTYKPTQTDGQGDIHLRCASCKHRFNYIIGMEMPIRA
jgi:phage FluMu protein Com